MYAQEQVFEVHRGIIAPKSDWFRERLPPPSTDGKPVTIFFPGEAHIIGHSLKFMYANRLDPCERKYENPRDIAHVTCCALFYVVAVDLRSKRMAAHVLGMLERATEDWKSYLDTHFPTREMSYYQGQAFTVHLRNALDTAYGHPSPDVVGPLRLALAGFLDVVLPLIVRQPTIIDLFSSTAWKCYGGAVTADLVEHRRRRASAQFVLAREEGLQALFDKLSKNGGDDAAGWSAPEAQEVSFGQDRGDRAVP